MANETLIKFLKDKGMTPAALAHRVGVGRAAAWKWTQGNGPRPEHAIRIELATKGEIPKSVLRPDLWPQSLKRKGAAA